MAGRPIGVRLTPIFARRRRAAKSASVVDVAAVADVVEIDASEFHVKFVKHAVIADAQFELGAALKTLVGKGIQRAPISSTLRCTLSRRDAGRASDARANVGDPIWSAAATRLLRRARGVVALRNLAARLVELGFDLGAQFKLVFQEFVNPRPQVFDLGARQSRNGRFNFLDSAHGGKIADSRQIKKPS